MSARRKAMKGVSVLLGADLALSAPSFLSVVCLLEVGVDRNFEKMSKEFLCVKATWPSAQESANRVTDKSRCQGRPG